MVQKIVSIDNRVLTHLGIGDCLIGPSYGSNQSGLDGFNSLNNYSRTVSSLVNPVVELHLVYTSPPREEVLTSGVAEAIGYPTYRWNDADDAKQELKALSKLVGKVRQHDWKPAVDLAEMNQTVELARSTVLRFARSYRSLKSRDISGAIRHLFGGRTDVKAPKRLTSRNISSQWLEMQYGWLPLMSSIHDAMKYHRARERKSEQRFKVRWTSQGSVSFASGDILHIPGYAYKRTQVIWIVTGIRGSELEQLGFTDPLQVLWEKTPFSFVVDWFLPIGTYLDVRNYVQLVVGSQVRSGKTHGQVVGIPTFKPGKSFIAGAGFLHKHVSFSRYVSPISQSDIPLAATFDSGGLRGRRIFNAVALAHQLVGARRNR